MTQVVKSDYNAAFCVCRCLIKYYRDPLAPLAMQNDKKILRKLAYEFEMHGSYSEAQVIAYNANLRQAHFVT